MKHLLMILVLVLFCSKMQAQEKYANDVESLDQIIAALYEVISGDKEVKRDWARFENLFAQDARLIPSRKNKEGIIGFRVMTPGGYVESSGAYLESNGFFEKEISRKTETYGSLVHVWSTYESYHTSKDEEPFARGINSIQLINDGSRWWIMQIYWLAETEDNPLPEKYLIKMK